MTEGGEVEAPDEGGAGGSTGARPAWRNPKVLASAAVAVLLAAGGVAYAATRNGGSSDSASGSTSTSSSPTTTLPRATRTTAPRASTPPTSVPPVPTTQVARKVVIPGLGPVTVTAPFNGPTAPPGSPSAGKPLPPPGVSVAETGGACRYNSYWPDYEDAGTVTNRTGSEVTVEVDVDYYDRNGQLLESDFDDAAVGPGGMGTWSTSTSLDDDEDPPPGGAILCRVSLSQ